MTEPALITRLPIIHVRLPCANEQEFLDSYGPALASRGVLVPCAAPPSLGTRVVARLQFQNGTRSERRGEVAEIRAGTPSMLLLRLEEATPAPRFVEGIDADRTAVARRRVRERTTPLPSVPSSYPSAPSHPFSADAPALEPFTFLGKHQVLRPLGGGGMGDVYLARAALHEQTEKLVALKTIRRAHGPQSDLGRMFLSEAQVSLSLRHGNVVQVFDFGVAGGRSYLAMEFIRGRDVTSILRFLKARNRPPPLGLAVRIAFEVARALEYIHERRALDGKPLSLVHRDVSPGNVLVSEFGEVKLLDFGVASGTSLYATHGFLVGKLGYMAPEQVRGTAPQPCWDVYALGAVLYELITLRRMFSGESERDLLESRREQPVPPSAHNPDVPAFLDRLVLHATQRDPALRFGSAREMREALQRAQTVVGPFDLGSWIASAFGPELASEQRRDEALIVEARRRTPELPDISVDVTEPEDTVLSSAPALRPAVPVPLHRRAVARAAAAVALLFLVAVGGVMWRRASLEAKFAATLESADRHLKDGTLGSDGEDGALGSLLEAKRLRPGDPRVKERLTRLADTFHALATSALKRGDVVEAAGRLDDELKADPTRTNARQVLATERSTPKRRDKRIRRGGAR